MALEEEPSNAGEELRRAIEAGYDYARRTLGELPDLPRAAAPQAEKLSVSSLATELERHLALKAVRAG